MTSAIDLCNQALYTIGEQTTIQSFQDGSPAANACATLYQPKLDALFRAAPWGFATKQIFLSQVRAVQIDGELTDDPPPQPWLYEYLYPSDCIRARFILPNFLPTSSSGAVPMTTLNNVSYWNVRGWQGQPLPYKIALDTDPTEDNDIKVILTNIFQAQMVYTKRVDDPNLFDPQFINAAATYLGVWLLNALGRNAQSFRDQIALSMDIIKQARSDDGNEGTLTVDNSPDWIRIRGGGGPTAEMANFGWYDRLEWPGGQLL